MSIGVAALGLFALAIVLISQRGSPEDRALNYYGNGVKFLEQKDYSKARIEFRNALRLQNDMLPAWRSLAQLEETTKHWDSVIPDLQSIVDLDPSDIEARIKLVRLMAISGRDYEALKLSEAGNEVGQNAKMLGLRATILYKLNDKPRALQLAREAVGLEPGNTDALVVLATDRLANDDAAAALKIVGSDAALHNADLQIQLLKLKIFEKLGDTRQIEVLLRSLVDQYPKEAAFRKRLTKFYVDQNRQDDAETEIRAVINASPTDTEAEMELIGLLSEAKGAAAAKQELVRRIDSGGDVFTYQVALAELEFAQGDFDNSEKLIRNVASHAGSIERTVEAQIALAQIYVKRDKTEAAEALVSDILSKDDHNPDALQLRASERIDRGQYKAAIADLREALERRPKSIEILSLLALAYERNGSTELAERGYEEAVRTSNFSAAVVVAFANFLERQGHAERAEQALREENARSPGNLDILLALAQAELTRQDWDSAQTIAASIRGAGDSHDFADQVLGAALMGQHKYEEAVSVFQRRLDASPSAAEALTSLVAALVRANKTDRAASLLKSTLQANPDNADARVLLGSVQLATQARDQAIESFKLAIEEQPKSVVGYQALANLYVGEKQFDQALKVIRTGLHNLPDSVILQLALAGALEQDHQYEAAIAEYEHMLSKQPGFIVVKNNLASLLADNRGDNASLERAQSLAASLQESHVPQFEDTQGWISYRRGDYVNAVLRLERAASALPQVALVHYHLGMIYIAMRQATKASEQLRTALSLSPDSQLEEKIREALSNLPT